LLAEAANSLGANDDDAPLPTDDAPTQDAPAAATSTEDESSGGSSKRVISPIDSSQQQAKPTLEELLALEEGKEAGNIPAATPAPVVDAVQAMESAPVAPTAGGVITPSSTPAAPDAAAPATDDASQTEEKKDGVNPHDISL
jgi:hypothetical protein